MKTIDYYIHDQLRNSGLELTKEQWLLLKILNDEDGRPQNDLAFITNRDKGSLARLLNTMENRNLVVRIPSKNDRRINEIYLTKHGRKVFNDSTPLFKKIITEIESGVSDEEKELIRNVMDKIYNNIKSKE